MKNSVANWHLTNSLRTAEADCFQAINFESILSKHVVQILIVGLQAT